MAKRPEDGGRGKGSGSSKAVKTTKRSQAGFYKVIGLVAAAFVLFLVYQYSKPQSDAASRLDPSVPLPEAKGYTIGRADAPVKVIEFADFECPACAQFFTLTEPDVRSRLIDSGVVQYTFMDFPLPMHKNTWPASNAAACANEQGKFWEMHDALFQSQDQWNGLATSRPGGKFKELAQQIGLDVNAWETCFDDQKYLANIRSHEAEAGRQGAGQTPTFIIGSRRIPGSISFDKFRAYVDTALAEAKATTPAAVADTSTTKK
ncbi:MAG: DsbA family protein [Gemmatimonadaceae bacterium]|nr:DsbA family protein [Gemmatimonadaceae bacterium]